MTVQIRSSFAELLASVVQTLLKDPLEQRALLQSVRLIFYQTCVRTHRVGRVWTSGVVGHGLPVRFWGLAQEYEMGDVREAGSPLVRPLVDRVFALVHTALKHALAHAHAMATY